MKMLSVCTGLVQSTKLQRFLVSPKLNNNRLYNDSLAKIAKLRMMYAVHLILLLTLKGTYSNKNNFNLGAEQDNYY